MAWVTPRVWTVLEQATAAKMNEISSALNDLDRRTSPVGNFINNFETTTSTTFTDLASIGPSATAIVGSGLKALVALRADLSLAGGVSAAYMGAAISGATTAAASDQVSIGQSISAAGAVTIRVGMAILYNTSLTAAGSTTFTAKYRGSGPSMGATNRGLTFQPLGS